MENLKHFLTYWALIISFLIFKNHAALIVYLNGSSISFPTTQIFYSGLSTPFSNFTGTMVYETNPSIVNHIVLAKLTIPPESTIRKYQARGAIAIVMEGYYDIPGFVMYVGQNGDTSDIVIPVVEVPLSNYSRILSLVQNYSSLEVTLTSTEPNVWQEAIESSWTYVLQIFFVLFSLAVLLFSIFRLAQFYEFNGGFRFNVPQVCLAFVIGSSLSLIVSALDPLGIRRIFDYVTNEGYLLSKLYELPPQEFRTQKIHLSVVPLIE